MIGKNASYAGTLTSCSPTLYVHVRKGHLSIQTFYLNKTCYYF